MKNLILFTLFLFLVSCGGGVENSPVAPTVNCGKNGVFDNPENQTASKFTIFDNNTESPLQGVVVQIDNKGSCIVSDAKGQVTFENIASGKHDFHLFGPTGYNWVSYYNVDTTSGVLKKLSLSKTTRENYDWPEPNSYLQFEGNIQGSLNNSYIKIINFSETNNISSYPVVDRAPVTSYSILYEYNEAPGTAITNEFWFLESAFDVTSEDTRLVDAVPIPGFTINSTATPQVNTHDITFRASTNKPAEKELLTLTSLVLPTGLKFNDLNISSSVEKNYTNITYSHTIELYSKKLNNLVLPKTFTSYIPTSLNLTKLNLSITATSGVYYDTFYSYNSNFAFDGITPKTMAITPKIVSMPKIIKNQHGNTISWSGYGANLPMLQQNLYISNYDINQRIRWRIGIAGDQEKIALPTIPKGVKPLLTVGKEYDIYLDGYYDYVPKTGIKVTESASHYGKWTR